MTTSNDSIAQQKGREHFLSLMHSDDDWTTRAQRLPIVVNALANCIISDLIDDQPLSQTQVEAYRIARDMNDRRAARNVRRYRARRGVAA